MEIPGLAEQPSWQAFAACAGLDSDLFFRRDGEPDQVWSLRSEVAKVHCRACPVREACDVTAIRNLEPAGIWGGFEFPDRWRTPLEHLTRTLIGTAEAAALPGV